MFLCCNCDTEHPGDCWQPEQCKCCKHKRFYWAPDLAQIEAQRNVIRASWKPGEEIRRRYAEQTGPVETVQMRKAPRGRRVLRERPSD